MQTHADLSDRQLTHQPMLTDADPSLFVFHPSHTDPRRPIRWLDLALSSIQKRKKRIYEMIVFVFVFVVDPTLLGLCFD